MAIRQDAPCHQPGFLLGRQRELVQAVSARVDPQGRKFSASTGTDCDPRAATAATSSRVSGPTMKLLPAARAWLRPRGLTAAPVS